MIVAILGDRQRVGQAGAGEGLSVVEADGKMLGTASTRSPDTTDVPSFPTSGSQAPGARSR